MFGTRWDVFAAGILVVLGTAVWQGCGDQAASPNTASAAPPASPAAPEPAAPPAPAAPPQDAAAPANQRKLADRELIAGRIVSIGAWLEATYGAKAEPELFSPNAQGLVTADGTLFTFVNNGHGNPVITNADLRGQEVRIFGWRYPKTQYVEIWSYDHKGDGGAWERMEWCQVCGYEPTGHSGTKDTDL